MRQLVSRLRDSRVCDWQRTVRGLTPHKQPKPHQRRLDYYEALCGCLDAWDPGTVFTGREARERLARAAGGGSSASTLYTLMGEKKQTYPSLRAVLSGTPLLEVLPRDRGLGTLIAEAKVWSHWPHREGWLDGLARTSPDDLRWAVTSMVRELAAWAARMPRLAAAGDGAAPVSAVEDLRVILDDRVAPSDVAPLLSHVVKLASGPLGTDPDLVLDMVYDDLMDLGFECDWYVSNAVTRLRTGFDELLYLMNRLDGETRSAVAVRLGPSFEEFKRLTEREKGA